MAMLGSLRRLTFLRRPFYKRVNSNGTRRISDPPPSVEEPEDEDPYEHDELAYGWFVYFCFLMLGNHPLRKSADCCRIGNATS
jgi:hypothetical protein